MVQVSSAGPCAGGWSLCHHTHCLAFHADETVSGLPWPSYVTVAAAPDSGVTRLTLPAASKRERESAAMTDGDGSASLYDNERKNTTARPDARAQRLRHSKGQEGRRRLTSRMGRIQEGSGTLTHVFRRPKQLATHYYSYILSLPVFSPAARQFCSWSPCRACSRHYD